MDEHVILGKPEIKIEHKSVEASLFGISFEQFLKDNELNFSFSADSREIQHMLSQFQNSTKPICNEKY